MTESARRSRRNAVLVALFLAAIYGGSAKLIADESTSREKRQPTCRSAHFIVHTDLPPDAANAMLERMEATLSQSSKYWKRPIRGLIECYVVDDLEKWQDHDLPHPLARILIGRVGGAAISERVGAGMHRGTKVLIFASSRTGVAEHEVVHAYCGQAFGTTGPLWYREGMAQMLAYGADKQLGVNCPPESIEQLKAEKRRTLRQVLRGDQTSRRLIGAFQKKSGGRTDLVGLVPLSNWSKDDVRSLAKVKRAYAWNWLVCHLLHHNSNYRSRFETLGQAYLKNRENKFPLLFEPVMDQLAFEYNFTLDRVGPGYRTDLCRWDWNKRFRCLEYGRTATVRVAANRGYQATGMEVTAGRRYRYAAEGTWQVNANSQPSDADGNSRGEGRLEAIVMKDYQLSEPFELACSGRFRSQYNGQLYVRCRDDWTRLGDNSGCISLTFSR